MIEVTAKLVHGVIYLSGEKIECNVTFSHPPSPSHKVSQSHTDVFENLAWGAVQIQCHCFTTSRSSKTTYGSETFGNTALGAASKSAENIEVSTKPKILFCDLQLAPGQSRTFTYEEKLPSDIPPSYRGQLIQYSYKVVISTQRVNSAIKLLKIPFRVLPLSEASLGDGVLCNDTTEELAPANPFLDTKQKENYIECGLQALQNITARRHPNFYMISNTWGRVARFCLFKPSYKLGEDIIGTFDFTVATVHCVQVSVSLQCEEEVHIISPNSSNEKIKQSRSMTFSKHHEVCLGYKYSQLILPIPLHVTPDFSTDTVTLKWKLHFEFVTSNSSELQLPNETEHKWTAPYETPIETMVWSLPIKLYATTPIHIAQGVQSNMTYKLNLR